MKLFLHERLHCKQHITVCIIEQVERSEDNQRGPRMEISLGHWSSEYSMSEAKSYPQPIITRDIINALHYDKAVIRTFATRQSAEIWRTGRTRGSPPASVAKRKLTMLDAASALADLRYPPGNRLEKLTGGRSGQYSIRINDQYRICFAWRGHD